MLTKIKKSNLTVKRLNVSVFVTLLKLDASFMSKRVLTGLISFPEKQHLLLNLRFL